jgi:hypothetical protein
MALRSAIWFFCDARHALEVDVYYFARSGVDIIETGWNLRLESACKFNLSRCSWFDRLRETNVWAALSPDERTKMNRKREKSANSQTSRLETPEELQLHHNHEKSLIWTILSLFAQCKMHYW